MAFFKGFVTVAADLIARLRLCPPLHMKAGDELKLTTFAVTEEDAMIASKLKIRDRKQPVAGEVYRLQVRSEKPVEFTDGRTGKQCKSRENLSVRLYPHDLGQVEKVDGELRFFTCPKGSEPIINPAPVFLEKVDGIGSGDKGRGVWWIASPGMSYDVSWTEPSDRLLFSGNIVVMLGGLPERQVPGAIKIDIANRVSVYDRRKDRLSSFARAEHIRRTISQGRRDHTFEFINLRDVLPGEVVTSGGPKAVLTGEGLKSVEEVEV